MNDRKTRILWALLFTCLILILILSLYLMIKIGKEEGILMEWTPFWSHLA